MAEAALATIADLSIWGEDNPLSQHAEHAAGESSSPPGTMTFQGGDTVGR